MDDAQLRLSILGHFVATGVAPTVADVSTWCGGPTKAAAALRRLEEAHSLVLNDDGSIRMALPFSAFDTGHTVVAGDQSWWANCAWDALAIPAALDIDASIEANWMDTGEPVDLRVEGGKLSSVEGFIHFQIPARHWWDDVVET